ncbi:MAG: NUDIX hydrolase [Gammaproteobacteria bacterium]|nr:NUDIX hydrolase [Gammaproteobacteria bacterium]
MKYCSQCGSVVILSIPPGDNRPRHVCTHCNLVHYQNPRIVTGLIPEWQDKVLLCRRAIEPRRGLWTLPAGFMENGESAHEGAAREALEEAHARVRVGALYTLFNLPYINQVYMIFRGKLLDLHYQPGDESLEVELFEQQQVPWGQLAFRVVQETLSLYFQDRERGCYTPRSGTIERVEGMRSQYRTLMLEEC